MSTQKRSYEVVTTSGFGMDLTTYQMPKSAPPKTTTVSRPQKDEPELHLLQRSSASIGSRTVKNFCGASCNQIQMVPYAHSAPATDRPYRELEESSPVRRIANKIKMSPLAHIFRPSKDEDAEILDSIINNSRNGSQSGFSSGVSRRSTYDSVEIDEAESCSTPKIQSRAGKRLSFSTVVPIEYQGSYYATPDYSQEQTSETQISNERKGADSQSYWMPASSHPAHRQSTLTSPDSFSHPLSPSSGYDTHYVLHIPGPNVYPSYQFNTFYDQSPIFAPHNQRFLQIQQQFSPQHHVGNNGQSAPHHSFPRPYNNAPLAAHCLDHFTKLFGTSPTYLPSLLAIAVTVGYPRNRLDKLDTIRKAQNYVKFRFVNIFDLVEAGLQGGVVDNKLIWKSPTELRAYSERERKVCPSEVGRGEVRGVYEEGNELWRWMLRKWY
jgi:hypothetical protein